MATLFYDHLIPWDNIQSTLEDLNLPRDEQHQVLSMIEEVVHTEVLMVILEHLPNDHHHNFLEEFHKSPFNQTHLEYLQTCAHPEIHIHIYQKGAEILETILTDEKPSILTKIKSLFR